MAKVVLAALIVVVLSGCGVRVSGGGDVAEPLPPQPVPAPIDPGLVDPPGEGDGATSVIPRPGMADVRAVAWESATVSDDRERITLTWWSGVEPCNVLDRVEVEMGENEVTATVFEGTDPEQPDAVCIDIAQLKTVTIVPPEPVGDRPIVDGAA